MARNYDGLPGQVSMAPPSGTGDALRMAARHRGAIRQIHNNLVVMLGFHHPDADPDLGMTAWWPAAIVEAPSPHTLIVNRAGRRFGNEAHFQYLAPRLREFDPISRRHVNLPCFLIFDRQYAERFSFAGRPVGSEIPPWVARAETLVELAGILGIEAVTFGETIEHFNVGAASGLDPEFGRGTQLWRGRARLRGRQPQSWNRRRAAVLWDRASPDAGALGGYRDGRSRAGRRCGWCTDSRSLRLREHGCLSRDGGRLPGGSHDRVRHHVQLSGHPACGSNPRGPSALRLRVPKPPSKHER